jgi:AraC-like DNA-binding protein
MKTEQACTLSFSIGGLRFHVEKFRHGKTADTPIHSHPENCHELHLVTDGSGSFCIDGTEIPVERSSLLLIGPNVAHSKTVTEGSFLSDIWLNMFITKIPGEEDPSAEAMAQLFARRFFHATAGARTVSCFGSALQEMNQRELGYQTMTESYLKQALIGIARDFGSRDNQEKPDEHTVFGKLVLIDDYFLATPSPTLAELSRLINLGNRQTERIITHYYGMTFRQKKEMARCSQARLLLRNQPWLTISQIAERLEYASIYSFSAAFKKHTGLSPRQYRNAENTAIDSSPAI